MGLDMEIYKLENKKIAELRKANMIHHWIEKRILTNNPEILEIYNNGHYLLTYNDLKALKLDIEFVLKNPQLAKEILPTRPGFFFGNLKYNENYYKTLKDTLNILNEVLSKNNHTDMFIYTANWWYKIIN